MDFLCIFAIISLIFKKIDQIFVRKMSIFVIISPDCIAVADETPDFCEKKTFGGRRKEVVMRTGTGLGFLLSICR